MLFPLCILLIMLFVSHIPLDDLSHFGNYTLIIIFNCNFHTILYVKIIFLKYLVSKQKLHYYKFTATYNQLCKITLIQNKFYDTYPNIHFV